MCDNIKKFLPLGVTISTMIGNYCITGPNGETVGSVSKNYQLPITPSNWTFSIWGIIYGSLLYLGYNHFKNDFEWNDDSLIFFTASGLFNIMWVKAWVNGRTKISQFLLYGIVLSLLLLWYENIDNPDNRIYQNIIALYAGWTISASILNTLVNINQDMINDNQFTYDIDQYITNLGVGSIITVQIIWQIIQNEKKKNLEDSIMIPLVGIWTGLGILSNSQNPGLITSLPLLSSLAITTYHFNEVGIKVNGCNSFIENVCKFLREKNC